MMRVKNQPLADDPSLIRNVQEEVAVENRPFLEFITRNAKYIIAIVVALILALAGTGLYRYMQKSEQEKVQTQLARIQQQKPDAAQLKALEDLAAGTPERLQPAVNAVLVQSALAQGKFEVALRTAASPGTQLTNLSVLRRFWVRPAACAMPASMMKE